MLKSDVIAYYGSRTAVAVALNISPAAVSQWAAVIPEKRAYQLERITNGQIAVDQSLYEGAKQVDTKKNALASVFVDDTF